MAQARDKTSWREGASGVIEITDSDDEPSEPPRPAPQRSEPRARPAEVRERDEGKEALCYYNMGQPAQALPLFEQARAIAEAAGDRAGADLARQGIAACYASMGQHGASPRNHAAGGHATSAFGQRAPAARDPRPPPAQEPMHREPVRAADLEDGAAPVTDGARTACAASDGFHQSLPAELALGAQQEGREVAAANGWPELAAALAKIADLEQHNARLLSDLEKRGEEMQQKDQELTGTLGAMEQERAELRAATQRQDKLQQENTRLALRLEKQVEETQQKAQEATSSRQVRATERMGSRPAGRHGCVG
jgi:hypothetical protein